MQQSLFPHGGRDGAITAGYRTATDVVAAYLAEITDPSRLPGDYAVTATVAENARLRPTDADHAWVPVFLQTSDDTGDARIGVQRVSTDPDVWQVTTAIVIADELTEVSLRAGVLTGSIAPAAGGTTTLFAYDLATGDSLDSTTLTTPAFDDETQTPPTPFSLNVGDRSAVGLRYWNTVAPAGAYAFANFADQAFTSSESIVDDDATPVSRPPSSSATTTAAATVPASTVPSSAVPAVASPSDVFVTVSGDQAVIDVRNSEEIVASFDLSCPPNTDCVIQSARVMGDTIWVAITDTDTEPGQIAAVVRSRVVSVSLPSGEVVEHLSREGTAAAVSAGLGADGVVYAHLRGSQRADWQLVAVESGAARVVETGVSGFRLSDDGQFLAVSFSNPMAGEYARFEITDLVDGTTSGFQTSYINAGPAAWSPDGRHLIVEEQWEDQGAWVIDPWSGSGEPIAGTDRFLDRACFMDDRLIAHRTWNVGYGQGDAQPGVIRVTSLETGSTVTELGDNLFGDGLRCHPDGSISYLRRPVVEVQLSPDFSQLEPDYEAPVDLVHISAEGTSTVVTSGDLRIV